MNWYFTIFREYKERKEKLSEGHSKWQLKSERRDCKTGKLTTLDDIVLHDLNGSEYVTLCTWVYSTMQVEFLDNPLG